MHDRVVKRYAAYFRGWCQTFGEHESLADHDREIYWLVTGEQAGFVLPRTYLRKLYKEVLLHKEAPPLTFGQHQVEVGGFQFEMTPEFEQQIRNTVGSLLASGGNLHIYLTSHFMYGTNARIITLSARKPLAIIYKEIGDIHIRID